MRWRRGFRRNLTGSRARQIREAPAVALSFSRFVSPPVPHLPHFRYTGLSVFTVNSVEFRAVSKSYAIYDSPGDRLTELLSLNRASRHRDFLALDAVSFSVTDKVALFPIPIEFFDIMHSPLELQGSTKRAHNQTRRITRRDS